MDEQSPLDQNREISTDQQPEASQPSIEEKNSSWRPADYYASPPPPRRVPRWVPISCGVAAALALVLMFAIGVFLKNGGLSSFVALAIGQFQGEMKGMVAEEISEEIQKDVEEGLREVRKRLTDGSLDQSQVLPLLQEIQKVSRDELISEEELLGLKSIADELLAPADERAEPVDI